MLQSIIEHFQKQGVSENVIFVGRLDFEHLMSLLKTADLFAYPTRWDNCPYSVLEAMVCHCPIVAARVGGLAEMLDGGRAGVLVPPGDARAFAREIISILKSKERAAVLAQSARQRVEHHYDYIRIARDTIHLYRPAKE